MIHSDLRRAVGRLVFARNSTVALNFMPLQPFHLDVAQDASLIMALRSLRETGSRTLVDQLRIGQWMDRLALRELAAAVEAVARSTGPGPLAVTEVGVGSGALFEYLKSSSDTELSGYRAVGPTEEARRFEMLHRADTQAFDYLDNLSMPLAGPDLLVLNQNQAIRYGHGCALDWLGLALAAEGPVVLALRVSLAQTESCLTVNGHSVTLSAAEEVRWKLRNHDRTWLTRLESGFDAGFFLPNRPTKPEEDSAVPDTALLLAVTGAAPEALPGYVEA